MLNPENRNPENRNPENRFEFKEQTFYNFTLPLLGFVFNLLPPEPATNFTEPNENTGDCLNTAEIATKSILEPFPEGFDKFIEVIEEKSWTIKDLPYEVTVYNSSGEIITPGADLFFIDLETFLAIPGMEGLTQDDITIIFSGIDCCQCCDDDGNFCKCCLCGWREDWKDLFDQVANNPNKIQDLLTQDLLRKEYERIIKTERFKKFSNFDLKNNESGNGAVI